MEKDVDVSSDVELPTIRLENSQSKFQQFVFGAFGLIVVCGGAYVLYNTHYLGVKIKLPPGPPPRNVFCTSMQSKKPCQALAKICNCEYGGIMTLSRGKFPTILITSTVIATQVLKRYKLKFGHPKKIPWPHKYLHLDGYQNLKCILPYNGTQWHKLRQIYVDHLLPPAHNMSFQPINQLDIQIMLNNLDNEIAKEDGMKPLGIGLRPHLRHASFKFIFNICFGKRVDAIAGGVGSHKDPLVMQLEALFIEVIRLGPSFIISDFVPTSFSFHSPIDIQRAAISGTIEKVLLDVIQEYKQRANIKVPGSEPLDLLDHLVCLKGDEQLHDKEIVWLLSELILANTDHVSTILEWTLAHLMTNPQLQEKLHQEIDHVCRKQTNISTTDFDNMPYLVAIVKESIRVSSPIMLTIPHSTTKELNIGGFRLPINTQIVCHLGALGQDSNIYENPLYFDPNRFIGMDLNLNNTFEKQKNIVHLMAQQFCPSRGLEILHVYIFLVKFLQFFEFSPLYVDIMPFNTSDTVEWGVINVLRKPLVACLKPHL